MNDLADRWTELGPVVWLTAAGLAGLWCLALGVYARVLDPRKVTPGTATLDLGGDEPPAVVNLLCSDWSLGREAVPATLIDLAARRWITIDRLGDRTSLQISTRTPNEPHLVDHERRVLDHVRRLAGLTPDGRVPAEALALGPGDESTRWWRSFRSEVIGDGRARGLSRPRWPISAVAPMIVAGVLVVLAFAAAGSTVDDDEATTDDERSNATVAAGLAAAVALGAIGGVVMRGERDTPEGRAAAAGWLGLRDLLAEDPLFAEQPAAGVAIWERHVSYGAALGVAHGAVRDLPMGAESERVAWSPVGGRWRVVRVAYRRPWPPGNGRSPADVALFGAALAALGLLGLWGIPALDRSLASTPPDWWSHVETIGSAVATGLAALGVALLVAALADRVTPPLVVEGRVLRLRKRTQWYKGEEGEPTPTYWHIAVDDGARDRIRAHRTATNPGVRQGRTVRLTASRVFRHVREVAALRDEVESAPVPPPVPTTTAAAGRARGSQGAAVDPVEAPPPPAVAVAPGGPPPPLPDAAAVSAAVGRAVALDVSARGHPLAVDGATAAYRGDGDVRVQLTWARAASVGAALPRVLRDDVPDLEPGAMRSRLGRGLAVPHGEHELLVAVHLPGASTNERDAAAEAVARVALGTESDRGKHAAHR